MGSLNLISWSHLRSLGPGVSQDLAENFWGSGKRAAGGQQRTPPTVCRWHLQILIFFFESVLLAYWVLQQR